MRAEITALSIDMSSRPQKSETYDVDLSTEERWIVHYVLVTRADEALDDRDVPPDWLVDLFERVEAGRTTITDRQARNLSDELSSYVNGDETPSRDVGVAVGIIEQLESTLEY